MNRKMIIGIGLIILVIAVCIGIYFIGNSDNLNDVANNTNADASAENREVVVEENSLRKKIVDEDVEENEVYNENILIAYFSLPETTGTAKEDSTIDVDGETMGNTEYVANLIQEHTGADMFRIVPVKQYNIEDHQALIDDAKEEQNSDARPEIKNTIDNFEDYDTIFIGYPIWWSDLPQIIYTFLESYDFSGKNVILFSTNGGSGLSGTVGTIKNILNDSNVNENAFSLHRNSMEDAPEEVESWLRELNIAR